MLRGGARSGSSRTRERRWVSLALVACVALVVVALAGCGSSKPGYCTDRTNLENSIKGLTSLNVSSGISGLQSQLQKIQSDATALVNSAKSDFPNETSAIKSSVDALQSAVKALPASPSAGQIATIASDASSVVSSVKSFTDATSSKCS
jgi:conjugal transfer/entry exclusion protein